MADVADLVAPETTTVLCMEMERGVVGDLAMPGFRTAVAVREAGLVERTGRVLHAARAAGVRVIHCTAAFRRDRAGSFVNTPALMDLLGNPEYLIAGTPSVDPVPELWEPDVDRVVERYHGFGPFVGTELDSFLKSLRAQTVVAVGVSLNRGIIGLTLGAVDNGYRVVIPRDGVVGYPTEYGDLVVEHTLAAVAWITTIDELVACWTP